MMRPSTRRSRRPIERQGRPRPHRRAGFVLLDLVLALAMFVVGGLAVLSQLDFGARRIIDAEQRMGATGVARTALGLLESGAMSDRELTGPASAWATPEGPAVGDDATAEWMCEVQIEPSEWPGLSLATVRVRRAAVGAGAGEGPVLATLHQLVPTEPVGGGP
ncbi:hypothetical protein AY599_16560 [Leptolyngbya valderiana BDU 20041]|nr:hypothetical protein AY599_16560 [Leptolyngbya valderiana BDU 20041]